MFYSRRTVPETMVTSSDIDPSDPDSRICHAQTKWRGRTDIRRPGITGWTVSKSRSMRSSYAKTVDVIISYQCVTCVLKRPSLRSQEQRSGDN